MCTGIMENANYELEHGFETTPLSTHSGGQRANHSAMTHIRLKQIGPSQSVFVTHLFVSSATLWWGHLRAGTIVVRFPFFNV